jgi:hypothetical protein
MEDVGILYVHLVCFTAIWYIWWPFGIFNGYVVYFSPLWCVFTKKNLAALLDIVFFRIPSISLGAAAGATWG